MQFLETLLSFVIGVLVVGVATQGRLNKHRFRLFALTCCVLVAHLSLEIPRWQIGTTYFVGIVSGLLLLKTTVSHVVLRSAGLVLALLLLVTSVFLSAQLPIIRLPSPSGPFRVGTTKYSLTDSTRIEAFAGDGSTKRELFVEVWYPAEETDELPAPRKLWSELHTGTLDRVSVFMNYMRGISTHSYPNLPPDSSSGPFPLIIFNHGLQLFTAQNTILMEHLASHGYVIVSIGHPYESLRVNLREAGTVLPPFITSWANFQKAMAWIEESSGPVSDAIDAARIAQTREERAELMLSAIDGASMNETVNVWARDSQFVLNELASARGAQHAFQQSIDFSRIAAMGMSVGGG